MKYPLLGKFVVLGLLAAMLLAALGTVGGVISERQRRQAEAEQSVAGSLAASQTLLGPILRRSCTESWTRFEGEGKERRSVADRRDFSQEFWPKTVAIATRATIEPYYRGLFKVNGYLSRSTIAADWGDASLPLPDISVRDAKVVCGPATLALALSDARGVREAVLSSNGVNLPLLPGSEIGSSPRGLHATLPAELERSGHLRVDITLALAGTRSIAWVPVADETTVQAASDWPHPSFGGQFLPLSREVSERGFEAKWQVGMLATSAQQSLRDGAPICYMTGEPSEAGGAHPACVDTFGVQFIDPVNPYVLGDRAIKYGFLFIVLTFVCIALVEVMRRLRVHPVQYLLVGCALTVFFLLLISLSEHLSFDLAYLCASAACTLLLTFYGSHVLGGVRRGLSFGAGIALLYGALYALLQLEQTALVLGAILLFVVLAAVMFATRRVDWYALAEQLRIEPRTTVPMAATAGPA